MSLPAPHDTLMYREAAEAADVIAAQFARNQVAWKRWSPACARRRRRSW